MRSTIYIISLAFFIGLIGCVPSLYPLYTKDTINFDSALLGTWTNSEGDRWIFEQSTSKSYKLTHHQKSYGLKNSVPGDTAVFTAHLVRLNDYLFIDIALIDPGVKNDIAQVHMIPAHTFSRVWIEGDILRFTRLSTDWLEEAITKQLVEIEHANIRDGIILTAASQKLQQFALTYAENKKVFSDVVMLRREK